MNRLIKNPLAIGLAAMLVLSACSTEEPVHSVKELMRNDVLLEATLVRCTQDRAKMRYEPECVNVRQAVELVEAREEEARREQLEAQSQRKREALRRTQAAVAEARRRAAERQRIIETGGVIVEFEETPAAEPGSSMVGSVSVASGDTAEFVAADASPPPQNADVGPTVAEQPATGNEAPASESASDIETVRQELERRSEDGNNP